MGSVLTRDPNKAFEDLLLRLEPNYSSTEERYKQVHLKLVKFFAWRRCEDAESLADETLIRSLKNLSEIDADKHYSDIYIIAKNVFRKYLRDNKRRIKVTEMIASDLTNQEQSPSDYSLDCQKLCLQKLSNDELLLLQNYILGETNREELAKSMGISLNALRLKLYRIKKELKDCYAECNKKKSSSK